MVCVRDKRVGVVEDADPYGLRFTVGVAQNPTVLGRFVKRPYESVQICHSEPQVKNLTSHKVNLICES